MKKRIYKTTLFILIVAVILSTTAFAVESRASDYIRSTEPEISASNGKVTVDFSIYATGVMSSVGAKKIVIYTSTGTPVKTYSYTNTNYSYLMASNKLSHSASVTYDGTPGTSYYAEITFYAGNSSGSDSITESTSVVKA